MARPSGRTKEKILAAAEGQLRRRGPQHTTLESVAREAGCAKGLVHYHYKTRAKLLSMAIERLWEERERRWTAAMRVDDHQSSSWIKRTWDLLVDENRSGIVRASCSVVSAGDDLTVRTTRESMGQFRAALMGALSALLLAQGLRSTVPMDELAGLLAGGIHGLGMELCAGTEPALVEATYAALWLGLLSSTRRIQA